MESTKDCVNGLLSVRAVKALKIGLGLLSPFLRQQLVKGNFKLHINDLGGKAAATIAGDKDCFRK